MVYLELKICVILSCPSHTRLILTDHCHFLRPSLLSLHSLSLSLPRPLSPCSLLLAPVQRFISNTKPPTRDTVNRSMQLLDSFLQQQIPFHPHYLSPHRASPPPPRRPFTHPQLSGSLHVASHKHPPLRFPHPSAGPSPLPFATQEPADPRSIMWERDAPSCSLGGPRPCRPALEGS